MTDFNEALSDIRELRRQVAETTEFRGYGPLTLCATAVVAVLAGVAQTVWMPDPSGHAVLYVALWLSTAVFCAGLIATQMVTRAKRLHSGMGDEMVRMAVAQFLPAGIAGAVLPFVWLQAVPEGLWMLPGLWQILFSLGVFASCRCLPRAMLGVGAWFLASGFVCLGLGGVRALTPVTMSGVFAVGMAAVAGIHWSSARNETRDEE